MNAKQTDMFPFNFSNMAGGKIAKAFALEVEAMHMAFDNSGRTGKGKITLTVDFERPENDVPGLSVKTKLTTKLPEFEEFDHVQDFAGTPCVNLDTNQVKQISDNLLVERMAQFCMGNDISIEVSELSKK